MYNKYIFINNYRRKQKAQEEAMKKKEESTQLSFDMLEMQKQSNGSIERNIITKNINSKNTMPQNSNVKKSNQKKLIVAETFVAYGSENALEKWDLQNGKYDLQGFSYCLKTSSYDENLSDLTNMQYSEYFFLRIKVPVIDIIDNGRKADLDLIYMNKSINHQFPYSISVRGSTYTCV